MAYGWWVWMVFLVLAALVWASRHRDITRALREQIPLRGNTFDGPPLPAPRVSVLIAAKDEEENIETAVRTFLSQDYPNVEFIVVNDRSTDGTEEILNRLQAETNGRPNAPTLKVVHVEALADGWFGKNNAMRVGLEHAAGEWFCFSDADCRQTSPRTLSMAMRYAIENRVDFLSILPNLEMRTAWERIIQPVCGALMVFWFHPKRVNNPNHRAAYANGAFMLMSRETYEALGGHEAVKTEVNEDMHLARLAKEKRRRLEVVQNDDLYSVRMYSTLRDIWRGWSRIFYGCFGTFTRLAVTALVVVLMNVVPYASLLIAWPAVAVQGWSQAGPWRWIALSATVTVTLQISVIARFYRMSRVNPWYAPTFIIGAVFCIGMLVNAMLKLGGRTTTIWRGTAYRGQKIAAS
jgi:cellulose synthase/poly-beta-1,6-N-acetylglucosamine synthase-like glycosyltransferase